jgi:hypothetical protein
MSIRYVVMVCVVVGAWSVSGCSSDPSATSGAGGVPGSAGIGSAGSTAQTSAGSTGVAGTSSSNGTGGGSFGGTPSSSGAGGTSTSNGGSTGGTASSAGASAAGNACTGSATYKITVDVTWTAQGLNGPHYTTIIGGVHSAGVSLWKLGGLATEGVKEMAEMGGTSVLAAEVNAAIGAGTAKAVIQFGGGNAPGTSTGTVELTPEFPRVSFGSMLAPTPDWFIGVSDLSLCEAGAWVTTKKLDAVVYDAGTKDGADFDYGFPETQPPVAIGYSVKFPGMTPAGTITFDEQ